MALFDSLIGEIGQRWSLGAQAEPLVREVVRLVAGGPGGVSGFLDKLKTTGLAPDVSSWIGGNGAGTLTPRALESAVGQPAINDIAGRVGMGTGAVSSVLAFAIPKAVGLLTPGGVVPQGLSPELRSFIGRPEEAAARSVEQVPPLAMTVFPDKETHLLRWGVPIVAILGLAALLWHLAAAPMLPRVSIPPAPVVSSIIAPRLWVSNDNGVASYSGLVRDDATRSSMIDALTRAFGAANTRGYIAVNSNVGPVPWLTNLPAALDDLKIPGTQALFEDNSVSVGGLSDSDRNKLISKLQSTLPNGVAFGALGDRLGDLESGATRTASAALAALKPGYSANDVVSVMNLSIINFATGSAEIPSGSGPLLQDAAARIQALPAGTVIEIDGYTDNVGDPNANLALSQRRADAVRSALIAAGDDPARLVAKGYGQSSPVSTNDTPEGRFRNRRIQYRVVNS